MTAATEFCTQKQTMELNFNILKSHEAKKGENRTTAV